MSRAKGALPVLLAVVFGVGNGLWVFYPAFKDQELEKQGIHAKTFAEQHADSEAMMSLKEAVANAKQKAASAETDAVEETAKSGSNIPSMAQSKDASTTAGNVSWSSRLNNWFRGNPKADGPSTSSTGSVTNETRNPK